LRDECNIFQYTDVLQCGKSYKDVLSVCIDCIDEEDFALWLCKLLSFERFVQAHPRLLYIWPGPYNSFSLFWELWHDEDWSRRVDHKAPKDFARLLGDNKLLRWLDLPCCTGIKIPNAQCSNPLLHYQIIPRPLALPFAVSVMNTQAYYEVYVRAQRNLGLLLEQGADPSLLSTSLNVAVDALKILLAEALLPDNMGQTECHLIQPDPSRPVSMVASITRHYNKKHPCWRQILSQYSETYNERMDSVANVFLVMTIRRFCVRKYPAQL
jgi:hypothetical protein